MITPDWRGTFWGSTPKGVPGLNQYINGKDPHISITSQENGLHIIEIGDGFRRGCPDHVPRTRAHRSGQPLATAIGRSQQGNERSGR